MNFEIVSTLLVLITGLYFLFQFGAPHRLLQRCSVRFQPLKDRIARSMAYACTEPTPPETESEVLKVPSHLVAGGRRCKTLIEAGRALAEARRQHPQGTHYIGVTGGKRKVYIVTTET